MLIHDIPVSGIQVGDVIVNWRWCSRAYREFPDNSGASCWYKVIEAPGDVTSCRAADRNGNIACFGTIHERGFVVTILREREYANEEMAMKLRRFLEALC